MNQLFSMGMKMMGNSDSGNINPFKALGIIDQDGNGKITLEGLC
jgi:hypothetical protein